MVGAPQQALERVVGKFFEVIEWFERHILGWTLPGDEAADASTMKVYEVLQNYTPPEAAYSFAQLKWVPWLYCFGGGERPPGGACSMHLQRRACDAFSICLCYARNAALSPVPHGA